MRYSQELLASTIFNTDLEYGVNQPDLEGIFPD